MRLLLLLALLILPLAAQAEEYKPDDTISLTLSTEGWVTTKTARVVVQVNASVSGEAAGTTRDGMMKAVQALAAGEWRLTSFNRNPSSAGLEDWYAQFEARLPETDLGGLNDKVKKASKPGMQLSVSEIDFTPTLAETEAVRASLRKTIMEMATAELKAVQALYPERNYRIGAISFNGMMPGMMMPKAMMAQNRMELSSASDSAAAPALQTAQRMQVTASIAFAAVAPVTAPAAVAK